MSRYEDYQKRKRADYGSKFDESDIDQNLIPYFNNGDRIEVKEIGITYQSTIYKSLRGTIGISTGWKPCLLLMLRKNSRSSSIILPPNCFEFVRVIKKGSK